VETADEYEAAWHEELPIVKEEAAAEAKEVIEAGGLSCWAPSGTSRAASQPAAWPLRSSG